MGKLLEVHKCEPNKTFWKSNSSYSRHLLSWMLLISKSCRTNLFMVPSLYFALYLEVFLRKSTIEKSILNKSLLFQTRQINNQLQDKVDQHLRQSVKQLTIENIFQKLMKLQRICTATPSWKRQKIFRFFHVFRDCSNAKLCWIDLTKINYCQCHTHLSKLYDI